MNQLTVRGLDDELAERIRRLAKRDGTSLNRAALKLLRKGAGMADPAQKTDTVGASLDHLIGSWSDDEAPSWMPSLRNLRSSTRPPGGEGPAGLQRLLKADERRLTRPRRWCAMPPRS